MRTRSLAATSGASGANGRSIATDSSRDGRRRVNSGGGVSITQSAGGALSVNVANSESVARYRLNLSVNIQNLLNRATFGGYSGVMSSPMFLQPTSASGVRRITVNSNLTF